MKKYAWLVLGLLIVSGRGLSQNCPAGIPSAGNPMCLPPDRENSPYYQGSNTYPKYRITWANRWGAIATDGMTASTGAVVGMDNKYDAEEMALAKCRQAGGENCQSILVYRNQCAVIVTGDKQHLAQGAVTEIEAAKLAMQKCKKIDNNCRVYYSDCSLPEQIK